MFFIKIVGYVSKVFWITEANLSLPVIHIVNDDIGLA